MQSLCVGCGLLVVVWGCVWDKGLALRDHRQTVHADAAAALLGVH